MCPEESGRLPGGRGILAVWGRVARRGAEWQSTSPVHSIYFRLVDCVLLVSPGCFAFLPLPYTAIRCPIHAALPHTYAHTAHAPPARAPHLGGRGRFVILRTGRVLSCLCDFARALPWAWISLPRTPPAGLAGPAHVPCFRGITPGIPCKRLPVLKASCA